MDKDRGGIGETGATKSPAETGTGDVGETMTNIIRVDECKASTGEKTGTSRNQADSETADVEETRTGWVAMDDDDDDDDDIKMAAASTGRKKDVDGGWAWMVLLGSFMNLLLASGIAFVSGIFQKLFLEEFGESVSFTAWVTALFSSLMQLAGPLSGFVTSTTNCRIAVMLGGAMIALGLAASSFASSLPFLLVTFGLISGTGLGLMYTPSIVIINYYFERRRTFMGGLSLSASGIGIIGSPILSRFLIDNTSWRESLLILAAVSAHACLFGALMFPLHEPKSSCSRKTCRARLPCCCREPEKSGDVVIEVDVRNDDVKLSDLVAASGVVIHSDSLSKIIETNSSHDHVGHQDDIRRAVLLNVLSRTFNSESREEGCSISSLHEDDADSEHDGRSDERARFLAQENEADVRERKKPSFDGKTVAEPPEKTGHPSGASPRNNHFSSRTSLNKISHHLDGTNARVSQTGHDVRNDRQYSSHHNLHGQNVHHGSHHYHQFHHNRHRSNSSLGRSLHSVDRRASSKGSKLDIRVLSVYSSIPSLHSLGLPPVEEIAALSPVSAVAAPGEAGEDGVKDVADQQGRCSNLMIFKNVPFLFLLANLFLSNAACGIFNIHLPAFSQNRGLDDHNITFVLAINGLALFASRLLLGILGNDPAVDKLSVYFGLHLLASITQVLITFAENIVSVSLFTLCMGTYYGGVYALLSVLTISVVGLPALAFAFGVEMIAAGLGYLVAPPLAGWIVDETANYNNSMYLGGLLMFLSAISLLCMSCGRPSGAGPIGYHPVQRDIDMEVDEEKS